jgi:hypothetical protein
VSVNFFKPTPRLSTNMADCLAAGIGELPQLKLLQSLPKQVIVSMVNSVPGKVVVFVPAVQFTQGELQFVHMPQNWKAPVFVSVYLTVVHALSPPVGEQG